MVQQNHIDEVVSGYFIWKLKPDAIEASAADFLSLHWRKHHQKSGAAPAAVGGYSVVFHSLKALGLF